MTTSPTRIWLAGALGLASDVLGAGTVERVVERRRLELGLASDAAYAQRLAADGGERAALIEDVVVPETWFFRDVEPFRLMTQLAAAWSPGRALRGLSVPCSTGEEPYSMVMALVDGGLAPGQIEVTAVDVSRRALERAAEGRYRAHSFRGNPDLARGRHFEPVGEGWAVAAAIKERVTLVHGNALQLATLVRGRFDVITCRNLLIYLTTEARHAVLSMLVGMLADDGLLIVGHADLIDAGAYGLARASEPSAFAYRRSAVPSPGMPALLGPLPAAGAPARSEDRGAAPSWSAQARDADARRASPVLARAPRSAAAVEPAVGAADVLARARHLADAGQLDDAARLLRGALGPLNLDPEAHHLLGMIESARGDRVEAEACLIRALYCDPGHKAALEHLAVLCEQRGDLLAAANYRRRAQRDRGGRR